MPLFVPFVFLIIQNNQFCSDTWDCKYCFIWEPAAESCFAICKYLLTKDFSEFSPNFHFHLTWLAWRQKKLVPGCIGAIQLICSSGTDRFRRPTAAAAVAAGFAATAAAYYCLLLLSAAAAFAAATAVATLGNWNFLFIFTTGTLGHPRHTYLLTLT